MQDDGGSQSEAEIERLKTLKQRYYQNALQALNESPSEIGEGISQYFLDKIWNEQQEQPSDKLEATVVQYACPFCGFDIQPGWNSTSLRVGRFQKHGASKTLRRRMQRKRRKLAIAKRKEAKDHNSLDKRKPKTADPLPKLVLLEDSPHLALDRHHIQIKCGRCQKKIYLKGLKRESPPTKQDIQQRQVHNQHIKQSSSKVKSTKQSAETGDDDFLQLPTNTGKRREPAAPQTISSFNPKKKKKKKKANENKSKLMDFLSSLND